VSVDLDGDIRFLQILDFLICEFNLGCIYRIYSSESTGAERDQDVPIISCRFSKLVVPTIGAVTLVMVHATAI
jgi:hypothetical protein